MKSLEYLALLLLCSNALEAQWTRQIFGSAERLTDVTMLDSTTAITVGRDGSIFRTSNSGGTWSYVGPQLTLIQPWNAISFFDSSNGMIVGDEGRSLITTNGGRNWSSRQIPGARDGLSVLYFGPGQAYVGADSGWVFQTADTGKTWTSEKISDLPIRSLFDWPGVYVAGLPVYALAPKSVFSTLEFPPSHWRETILGPFQGLGSEGYRGEFCRGGGAGFIVGVYGDFTTTPAILRKKMSDTSWQSVPLPGAGIGYLLGVSAPSADLIYACGTPGMILKTTDGGDTWVRQSTPTILGLNAISFSDEKHGIAVGDSGTVLFTSNGGIPSSDSAPGPFHLLRPTDGDTMPVMRSITFAWGSSPDPDGDTLRYSVLISSDRGATWSAHGPTADTMLQIQSPAQIPGLYFWMAIATDGKLATPSLDIFRFTITGTTDAPVANLPARFTVYPNYPNPFNPSTTFRFRIASASFVSLRLFDVLGREVATLLSEKLPSGVYTREWNASSIAGGVYFGRFEARDAAGNVQYRSVNRLVLVK